MIYIDYKDRRPIYEQIIERFEQLIIKGIIKPHAQMPSVRSLAVELSINPNTIQRAYQELERAGIIYTVKGKGSFVGEQAKLIQLKQEELLSEFKRFIKKAVDLGIRKEVLLESIENYDKGDEKND